MFDYFKSQEYFVDHLWFVHEGIRYNGKGVLYWDPEDGFHIVANIKHSEIDLPFQKEFRSVTFGSSTSIYLRLSGGSHVVLPVFFPNEINLFQGHLSEDSKRAIFIEPVSVPVKKHWFGSALLELTNSITLPDSVSIKTKIGESQPRQSFSLDGIYYETENGLKVIGYQKEKKYLELSWSLPINNWTKTKCWEYARGLQYSISVLAGQTLELKYREVYRAKRRVREVFLNQPPVSLGLFFRPFDFDILDREKIVDLATFFVRYEKKAEITKKMFLQMAEASRQRTKSGQELLLSTILEAALRSIYEYPFDPNKNKRSDPFRLDRLLKRFREDYLASSKDANRRWKKVTSEVAKSHRLLRDRNAHPDWLSTKGGYYSKDKLEQAANHMIFLSRFYGYMIMGLANFKYGEPKFPLPVSEWKPIMTTQIGKPKKKE